MKKIALVLLITTIGLACKNEPKSNIKPTHVEQDKKVVAEINSLSTVDIPDLSKWYNNEITIIDSEESYNGELAKLISRNDSNKPGYSGIDNLNIFYGSTYRLSIIIKRADIGKNFALRMQGVYPNRVDAVFDLETGIVKEALISGEGFAENSKAEIESLGNGWYKCILYADVFSEYIRVVLGPTTNKLITGLWETRTGEKSNAYFIPSSLKLEEF